MPPPAEGFAARFVLGPALRTQPDRRLVTLVREGYENAFEEIVRRYGKPLTRYAAAIVGGRAEDVTQDAFSKALLALRRDGAEIELRPWLFRIVRNTALNDLRDSPPSAAALAEVIASGASPAEELERREELADLMRRLQSLPEAQRAAIVMRELEGLSHEEIASALGLSDGGARQAIYRARRSLRDGAGMLLPLAAAESAAGGRRRQPGGRGRRRRRRSRWRCRRRRGPEGGSGDGSGRRARWAQVSRSITTANRSILRQPAASAVSLPTTWCTAPTCDTGADGEARTHGRERPGARRLRAARRLGSDEARAMTTRWPARSTAVASGDAAETDGGSTRARRDTAVAGPTGQRNGGDDGGSIRTQLGRVVGPGGSSGEVVERWIGAARSGSASRDSGTTSSGSGSGSERIGGLGSGGRDSGSGDGGARAISTTRVILTAATGSPVQTEPQTQEEP